MNESAQHIARAAAASMRHRVRDGACRRCSCRRYLFRAPARATAQRGACSAASAARSMSSGAPAAVLLLFPESAWRSSGDSGVGGVYLNKPLAKHFLSWWGFTQAPPKRTHLAPPLVCLAQGFHPLLFVHRGERQRIHRYPNWRDDPSGHGHP